MIPPVNSLVRYDNPILVASSKGKKGEAPKAPAAVTQTEDILNSILPPR
jgi:dynein light intermediate chain